MWPDRFEQRLQDWSDLRSICRSQDLETCLHTVNDWWQRVPMVNHYIHRDDVQNWPDPWQLLNDNIYCDLARALGIVYTMMSIEHEEAREIDIAYTDQCNLVLINQGIYILNWAPRTLLNIESEKLAIHKLISSEQLKNKYN